MDTKHPFFQMLGPDGLSGLMRKAYRTSNFADYMKSKTTLLRILM